MRLPTSSRCAIRLLTAVKIVGGFAMLAIGLVLAIPGVPGPGIPLVLLGLVSLSNHFAWARRSVAWLKQKTDRLRRKRWSFVQTTTALAESEGSNDSARVSAGDKEVTSSVR